MIFPRGTVFADYDDSDKRWTSAGGERERERKNIERERKEMSEISSDTSRHQHATNKNPSPGSPTPTVLLIILLVEWLVAAVSPNSQPLPLLRTSRVPFQSKIRGYPVVIWRRIQEFQD